MGDRPQGHQTAGSEAAGGSDSGGTRPAAPLTRRPTVQQEAIYEAIRCGTGHLCVEALAGSGKTSTAIGCLSQGLSGRVGFVAFNQHIAAALSQRLPPTVSACTLHSLGFAAVRRRFPGVTVDEAKLRKLAAALAPDAYAGVRIAAEQLARLCKYTLTPERSHDRLRDLIDHYGLEVDDRDAEKVLNLTSRLVAAAADQSDVLDYDDMVWFPHRHNIRPEQYDLLCVDEAQDLNRCQQSLARAAAARLCPIGDRHQCQPAGTMVTLAGGRKKPIEELGASERVLTWDRRGCAMLGRNAAHGKPIEEITHRPYAGRMLVVSALGLSTRCTPEHRWVTRFVERPADCWVTYLMQRGSWFRVGWCQLFDQHGGFHLGARARNERAEHAWILALHHDKTNASLAESITATRFGLPTLPFEPVNGAQHITHETIDRFFMAMGEEGFLEARVRTCLTSFGRMLEHPLYTVEYQQRQGRTTLFETQTCNLIPGIMAIPVYHPAEGFFPKTPLWAELDLKEEYTECEVYSLKVQDTETYVADGLVTHNSIYGFTGADTQGLETLTRELRADVRPLTVTWRCPALHVELARKLVPALEAAPGAIEGEIATDNLAGIAKSVRPGDLVICRKNAPVVGLTYRLVLAGVPALMRGREIGRGLITFIHRLKPDSLADLIDKVEEFRDKEERRLRRKKAPESQFDALADRCDCLGQLAVQVTSLGQLETFISSRFDDNAKTGECVVLSSAHRAKGLEADRVFVLDPDSLPLIRRDSRSWQIVQEKNLCYIAATRAKRVLTFQDQVPSIFGVRTDTGREAPGSTGAAPSEGRRS